MKYLFASGLVGCAICAATTACSDMLDTTSEMVEFQEDNKLNHPTDSVYSVMGIIGRIQHIADRTVLLGEVRGDLVQVTDAANIDLKQLANFDASTATEAGTAANAKNRYNVPADYYAVINNCNYYLAHVDTALQRRGRQIFKYEYAAVKAFRAWTYLELVKAYGKVPLVTKPVMTELEAIGATREPFADINEVCNYFIEDLTPYAADITLPMFGEIDGYDSRRFFIPMRALLGDLCLWAGRYQEAAQWYHDYLSDYREIILLNANNRVIWGSVTDFQRPPQDSYLKGEDEVLSFIPMEERVFDGVVSYLPDIFNSTRDNNYFFQVTPSQAMRSISAEQIYCLYSNPDGGQIDTVYAPRTGYTDNIFVGDLRLSSNYSQNSIGGQDPYSEYSTLRQTIKKVNRTEISTYRRTLVYLRYAEALNRAGLPQSAFAVLKYGLCSENNYARIDSIERAKAGDLITFPEDFKRETVIGIHSFGSGDTEYNQFYVMPQPERELATRQDTILYQIPLVEDLIIQEMALEGAFEGQRYYDLMRVALRRNDPAYLADPISRRDGIADEKLRSRIMDINNWYLKLN